jgi:enoyl-CoA hydratase/carnithine racemase
MSEPGEGWRDILIERHGPVTVCAINRPERLNAVSRSTTRELAEFRSWFEADPAQRVVVLTGTGRRAFCTGADIGTDLLDEDVSLRPSDVFTVLDEWAPSLDKPWICAINGVCAGGGLHFLARCDFVIASDTAIIMDPHVSIGHVSGLEPIALAQRMPMGEVLRLALTGRHDRMSAARAYELGLVTELVAPEELLSRAIELAGLIALNSPAAVAASRAAIRGSVGTPLSDAYRNAWDLIGEHARHHPDAAEGPRAFAEKRAPVWKTE